MRRLVRFIAIAPLAVALTACALQDGLIFFRQPPAGAPQLKAPAVLEEVGLRAADGTRLYGWIARHAQGRAPLVIYFGGNAEEISWFVGESGRLNGWSMLAVNYRGYGRSEGEPGEQALFADALTVYDHCVARPDVDPRRIVLMGRSLGSAVAVHLASHRPVAGVVLVTPFDSLVEVGASLYPFLPVRSILRHRFDSLSVAPSVKAPALMIAGERDTIVPARHARRLYDAWGGPREWVELPEAGHNDLEAHAAYWSAIRRFLDTLARKAGE